MWRKMCIGWTVFSLFACALMGVAFAAPEKVEQAPRVPELQEQSEAAVSGQETQEIAKKSGEAQTVQSPTVEKQPKERRIVINIASRSLALYEGNEKIRLYPLGVGKASTPTPTGYYKIRSKDVNPTWIDPSDTSVVIPSGERNPLGYRWMLLYGHYGIHGTNRPDSIGHYVSNGCIRMREPDVEALFDLVEIGTPVEITYNRVVVEKIKDNTVVYYIYPDGYDRQPLDVALVDKWLSGYGINSFESNEEIREKIAASDGEPTYVGKVYNLFVNGKKLPSKAVVVDNVTYLPAVDVASALQIRLDWKPEAGTLATAYGNVKGYDKKDVLYFDAADMETLFHVEGGLDASKAYVLRTKQEKAPEAAPAMPVPDGKPSVKTGREIVPADEKKKTIHPVIGLEEIR